VLHDRADLQGTGHTGHTTRLQEVLELHPTHVQTFETELQKIGIVLSVLLQD